MPSKKEYANDHNIGWLLKSAFDVYHRETLEAVRKMGFEDITASQTHIIALMSEEPIQSAKLAELIGVSKQAMSVSVTELVKVGYLVQMPDPDDGRARLLELTPLGLKLKKAGRLAKKDAEAAIKQLIGAKGLANLAFLLECIIQ